MKQASKKTQAPAAPVKQPSFHLAYFVSDMLSREIPAITDLCFSLQRGNRDIRLSILLQENNEELIRKVKENKSVSELSSLGKLQFVYDAENPFGKAVKDTEADFVVPVSASSAWNVSKTLQEFVATVRQETPAGIFIGNIRKEEDGKAKASVGSLLGKLLYKFSNAFFSPSNNALSYLAVSILDRPAAVALSEAKNIKSPEELLNLVYMSGMDYEEIPVVYHSKETGPSFFTRAAKTTLVQGLSSYFYWFVQEPLAVIRSKKSPLNAASPAEAVSRLVFLLLFVLCLFLMPTIVFDYGVTWDEKIQYEYAKDMYKYLVTFGEDKTVFDMSKGLYGPMSYYGSFFDVLTVAVNDVFGFKNEYDTRHFLNAIFGILGLLFAGLTARIISKSWVVAVLAFVLLLLTPSYFGHSMNNPKDVPFATGFYMAMYFLVRFLKELPRPTFATLFFLISGIALSISIRVGGILLFPFLGLFMFVKWAYAWRKEGMAVAKSLFLPYLRNFLIVLVFGYFLGLIFWPYAMQDPFTNPIKALQNLSNVNYTTSYELFDGERIYMSKVPWHYSMKFIGITAPLILLIGLLLHLAFVPRFIRQNKIGYSLMLAFIFVFPIMYAVYKESMLYNGWRHWFFIYFTLVVLAAMGWKELMFTRVKVLNYLAIALFAIGAGRIVFWMVKNHPNEYVYFNELVGGINGAYSYFETDYYSNSLKEAVEWFTANVDVKSRHLTVVTNNEPLASQYYMDKYTDSVDVMWTREYELSKKFADYAFFTTRTMTHEQLSNGSFPPKGTVYLIKVDDVPICAVVKRENDYLPKAYAFSEKGQADSAIFYGQKYLAYDTLNEEAYRVLGMTYFNMGAPFFDTARYYLDKSLALYPQSFMAWDIKGMIYFNQNDFATAEKMFRKSIGFKINYTSAHYNLGITYLNLNKNADAIKEFEKSVQYGGQKPEFYNMMGIAFSRSNNRNKAIRCFEAAISLNQNYGDAYKNMGLEYQAMGDAAKAQEYFSIAQQLGAL